MFHQFSPVIVPEVIRPNSPTFNEVYGLIKEKMEAKEKVRVEIAMHIEARSNNNSEIRKIDMQMEVAGHSSFFRVPQTESYWQKKIPIIYDNKEIEAKIEVLNEKIVCLNCDIHQMVMVLKLIKEVDTIRNNEPSRSVTAPIESKLPSIEEDRRHRRGSK